MSIIENANLMEPLLPSEANKELADLCFDLISQASSLASNLPKSTVLCIGDLVRSMNCYYSNLIEGHNTHPVDIERALNNDYSTEPKKRVLQKEAFAHIEVQRIIDTQELKLAICSKSYLCWLHREFYTRLPEELLYVEDPETGRKVKITAGEFRNGEVKVGSHIAPTYSNLDEFLNLFESRYESASLSKIQKVVAVAASHHRLLWIHPFFDGNGRVARLFSHAFFKQIGLGSSLWSVSRGLARAANEYRQHLAGADDWRLNDLDGRGNLSEHGLTQFCAFFLKTCIDQVSFMARLLEPQMLLARIEKYCAEEEKLEKGSFQVIREIILGGELERGKVEEVTGYKDRQSRKIVKALADNGIITSESTRAPLKLKIPHAVVESWFPKLYPVDL